MRSLDAAKALLDDYYRRMARPEKPIAWCSAMGPVELLRAFGYEIYFPENHAALIGARRVQDRLIPRAVAEGFSPETCSYLLSDIGAHLAGETPLRTHGLETAPAPALLAVNTNQCREIFEWFSWYKRTLDLPMVDIRTPRPLGRLGPAAMDYLLDQWEAATALLESLTGKKLDRERLSEGVRLTRTASRLWEEFLKLNAGRGYRHSFFEDLILMAPMVILRGTRECVDFYDHLLAEARTLPDRSAGRRLFWDGMPVWGKMRFLSQLLEGENAGIVASTYALSWVFDLDASEPLEGLARAYARLFICLDEEDKLDWLEARVKDYGAQGVIFHEARTCAQNSNARFGMPQHLRDRTGLPCLTLFGDMVDLRHFSESETRMRLEAFLENHV